jgi:Na+/H+-dicarboxylate symporter
MFRTATNVWSDSCGAVIIAKSEEETLKVDNEKGGFKFPKFF